MERCQSSTQLISTMEQRSVWKPLNFTSVIAVRYVLGRTTPSLNPLCLGHSGARERLFLTARGKGIRDHRHRRQRETDSSKAASHITGRHLDDDRRLRRRRIRLPEKTRQVARRHGTVSATHRPTYVQPDGAFIKSVSPPTPGTPAPKQPWSGGVEDRCCTAPYGISAGRFPSKSTQERVPLINRFDRSSTARTRSSVCCPCVGGHLDGARARH